MLPAASEATNPSERVLALGAGDGILLRLGVPRGVGAALTGAAFLPLAVVVILILATYLGGVCIGEELG